MIQVLDQETINKIAAGEVVERPASVVKELVENAVDAGATAVTVEIRDGGTTLIRITDNGAGIEKDEVPTAFIRHATSKILTIEDLLHIKSLGFRGEALASIAAVSQVECITKTAHALTGIRYEIHGSREIAREEIGAPTGTTLLVRNLFYNVPARKKFLKTATTEAGYITDLITGLALSRPDISFKYIVNGNNRIATSGNGKLKDVIYHIYGKEIASNLLPVKRQVGEFAVEGYIGKSFVSKGNRSFEHYFVNGRAIKSAVVTRAIEEAYKSFVMIHKFPFTAIHLTVNEEKLDVNVHPAKREFKYSDGEQLFDFVKTSVRQALLQEEMIPDVSLRTAREQQAITIEQQRKHTQHVPEPFEKNARIQRYQSMVAQEPGTGLKQEYVKQTVLQQQTQAVPPVTGKPEKPQTLSEPDTAKIQTVQVQEVKEEKAQTPPEVNTVKESLEPEKTPVGTDTLQEDTGKNEQLQLFISEEARPKHRLIGQVFKTYWLIEFDKKLYIMDQHAAHEKVMFERLMRQMAEKQVVSQQLMPAKTIHLDGAEHAFVMEHMDLFEQTGFDIEDFGEETLVIRAVPDDIMGVDPQQLFDALVDAVREDAGALHIDFFVGKLSGMACKAAIKGNTEISFQEADALLDELLTLDNPYNCPHGRPTMISLTQSELERKFKRIQN